MLDVIPRSAVRRELQFFNCPDPAHDQSVYINDTVPVRFEIHVGVLGTAFFCTGRSYRTVIVSVSERILREQTSRTEIIELDDARCPELDIGAALNVAVLHRAGCPADLRLLHTEKLRADTGAFPGRSRNPDGIPRVPRMIRRHGLNSGRSRLPGCQASESVDADD